jgi:glycosyltransferase involved in cell wall biosynthesis
MAAHNADGTIRQAVNSLLTGTLPCHLVVIDDCSQVPVESVLGPSSDRVEVIRLAANAGPAAARNVGLAHILDRDYEYVAIMDADDVAHPERLAKQVAFLDRHPDVGAVGTWARFFDEASGETLFVQKPPKTPDGVRKAMFFNSGLVHPSVLMRTAAIRAVGAYSENYPAAEDYELLRRIATRFDLANIPECLLDYRVSSRGVSVSKRRRQLFDRLRIQLKYFDAFEWRAWAGILQTLLLFVVPIDLLTAYKAERIWRMRPSAVREST